MSYPEEWREYYSPLLRRYYNEVPKEFPLDFDQFTEWLYTYSVHEGLVQRPNLTRAEITKEVLPYSEACYKLYYNLRELTERYALPLLNLPDFGSQAILGLLFLLSGKSLEVEMNWAPQFER